MAVNINIPSQVTQEITEGVTSTAPSEDAVFNALADKANSADLALVATSGDYNDLDNLPSIPSAQVNSDWNATSGVAEILNKPTITSGTVISVDLTMPAAFSVTGNPVTSSGTLAVAAAGLSTQYIRGDGQLANFPTSSGGGSSLNFYLNGSVAQGTLGGVAFKQMSSAPVIGTGTDFSINADGYIQSFITDASVPNQLSIPGGNWNFEMYFSASSNGGTPRFYLELYKLSAGTLTLLASSSANPEYITNGTTIDLYTTALAVPSTVLLAADRLAVRVYVIHSSKTITLHTENGHLCQVITTFSTGLTALNGLTTQVQNLAVGTSGTDFAISSATNTHTFNLPTASATNRGALSTSDWSAFNGKQATLVSGTNIKSINGTSLLGSGDITVGGGIAVGTTAVTLGTIGRVFFQGTGNVVQQSASLFWDNTNARLGIGTSAPSSVLNATSSNSDFRFSTGLSNLTPTIAVINTDVGGKAAALVAGTGGSAFCFDQAGQFSILSEAKSAFTGNTLGGGTLRMAIIGSTGNVVIGGTTPGARLDVRAQGALSTDIAFRVRNSADDRNLFSILGNGDIEVRTNRVGINQSTRLSIGGSNADNGLDAVGYTENTIVGFNNVNTGRRATLIGSSNTIVNAGTNACTTVGYGNSNRENGVVVGHSNTLGGIVLGTNNTGGGVGRTAVIGDSNIVSEANGNPGQPMFLIGNGVTLPNLSAINNCVFLSAGNNSTAPFNTFKNDNLLIGSLTPWTTNFDNSSRGVFYTKNGTAPTTLAADSFGMYSADIVAGNAAPHFRTENGNVIKLYRQSSAGITTVADLVTVLTNLGLLA